MLKIIRTYAVSKHKNYPGMLALSLAIEGQDLGLGCQVVVQDKICY